MKFRVREVVDAYTLVAPHWGAWIEICPAKPQSY